MDDIAINADLLFDGDGSKFMNKLAPPPPKAEKKEASAPKTGHRRCNLTSTRPAITSPTCRRPARWQTC